MQPNAGIGVGSELWDMDGVSYRVTKRQDAACSYLPLSQWHGCQEASRLSLKPRRVFVLLLLCPDSS